MRMRARARACACVPLQSFVEDLPPGWDPQAVDPPAHIPKKARPLFAQPPDAEMRDRWLAVVRTTVTKRSAVAVAKTFERVPS